MKYEIMLKRKGNGYLKLMNATKDKEQAIASAELWAQELDGRRVVVVRVIDAMTVDVVNPVWNSGIPT